MSSYGAVESPSSVLLPQLSKAYIGQARLPACIHCCKQMVWKMWLQSVFVTSTLSSKLPTPHSARQITQEVTAYTLSPLLNCRVFSLMSLGDAGVIAEVSEAPLRLLRAAQIHHMTMLQTTNIMLSGTYTDTSTSTTISTV